MSALSAKALGDPETLGSLTLYFRKAVWMTRAASYSSRCSWSESVSRAKSLSILPLVDAERNSAQEGAGGRARRPRSKGSSLWGEKGYHGAS